MPAAAFVDRHCAQAAQPRIAVFLRHADVADHHIIARRLQQADRIGGGGGDVHLCAPVAEQLPDQVAGVLFVVDDQDPQAGQARRRAGGRGATAHRGMQRRSP